MRLIRDGGEWGGGGGRGIEVGDTVEHYIPIATVSPPE